MLASQESNDIRKIINLFEKKIDEMHLGFSEYYKGMEQKIPDLEKLERDLITFSRYPINELILSKNLERILYKFQNRKKIWLSWVKEVHEMTEDEEDAEDQ